MNYVFNTRSTCTKYTLNSCSMVHAGVSGSLCKNVFWAENDMDKLREIRFLYKARCFRVYLT